MVQDFVDHSMKSYVWVSMEWKDPTSAWNQEEYGGVDSISMPPVSIWTPDLSVYNESVSVIPSSFAYTV